MRIETDELFNALMVMVMNNSQMLFYTHQTDEGKHCLSRLESFGINRMCELDPGSLAVFLTSMIDDYPFQDDKFTVEIYGENDCIIYSKSGDTVERVERAGWQNKYRA